MPDGDDGDDKLLVFDLVNDPVVADADAVGIASF